MKNHPEQQSSSGRQNRKEELKKQFYKTKEQSRAEYEEQVEVVSVPSAYGKLFRNISLIILAGVLVVLGIFMGRELVLDRQSRENVAALQAFVAETSEEGEMTTAEIPEQPRSQSAAITGSQQAAPDDTEQSAAQDHPQPETETATETSTDTSAQPLPPERMEKYWQLYQRNNDFCGWLSIPETVVDYPVMHRTGDNDFYLSHNFDGEPDVNGLLVLDKRCSADGNEDHLLIHGHNMKSGFMFGGLKNYKDPAYCAAHPTIRYDSLFNTREYEIFAVFLSSTNLADPQDFHYYDYIQIDSEESFDAYVSSVRQQSLYPMDVSVEYGDDLLTLSTCDYTKDNGRLVIVARSR
ncbi:MAG: class B sortase [Lachnospiraceae bacterium]|nr:class B sortase [Lachnospiraceae bacterium]